MSTTEAFNKMKTIVENDEQSHKKCCEILGKQIQRKILIHPYETTTAESAERYTKFHESESFKQFADKNENLNNLLKRLEVKLEELKNDLAKLEMEREKLKSKKDYSQNLRKLEDLGKTLKCLKAIFPVKFDYTNKNIAGLLYNKNTGEYHGFELSPKDTTNIKYVWKHLSKLYKWLVYRQ